MTDGVGLTTGRITNAQDIQAKTRARRKPGADDKTAGKIVRKQNAGPSAKPSVPKKFEPYRGDAHSVTRGQFPWQSNEQGEPLHALNPFTTSRTMSDSMRDLRGWVDGWREAMGQLRHMRDAQQGHPGADESERPIEDVVCHDLKTMADLYDTMVSQQVGDAADLHKLQANYMTLMDRPIPTDRKEMKKDIKEIRKNSNKLEEKLEKFEANKSSILSSRLHQTFMARVNADIAKLEEEIKGFQGLSLSDDDKAALNFENLKALPRRARRLMEQTPRKWEMAPVKAAIADETERLGLVVRNVIAAQENKRHPANAMLTGSEPPPLTWGQAMKLVSEGEVLSDKTRFDLLNNETLDRSSLDLLGQQGAFHTVYGARFGGRPYVLKPLSPAGIGTPLHKEVGLPSHDNAVFAKMYGTFLVAEALGLGHLIKEPELAEIDLPLIPSDLNGPQQRVVCLAMPKEEGHTAGKYHRDTMNIAVDTATSSNPADVAEDVLNLHQAMFQENRNFLARCMEIHLLDSSTANIDGHRNNVILRYRLPDGPSWDALRSDFGDDFLTPQQIVQLWRKPNGRAILRSLEVEAGVIDRDFSFATKITNPGDLPAAEYGDQNTLVSMASYSPGQVTTISKRNLERLRQIAAMYDDANSTNNPTILGPFLNLFYQLNDEEKLSLLSRIKAIVAYHDEHPQNTIDLDDPAATDDLFKFINDRAFTFPALAGAMDTIAERTTNVAQNIAPVHDVDSYLALVEHRRKKYGPAPQAGAPQLDRV